MRGRNGGICEGHERGGAFEEEGGEGDMRMSFLHLETVLYNWGRLFFVKFLYKFAPSPIVKFFV